MPFHITVMKLEDIVTGHKLTGLMLKRNKSNDENNFQVLDSPGKEKTQCSSDTSLMKSLWKLM
jgi:hypothetical protein